ncbi:GPO family capsid scaffolding protein [Glaciimonas sp. PAMC28666]|uniref:GPO family capsid scaffolding protein n=1 Tax=Glaciimonas sp. PAMC28666 TaxID=2807626 RepID=UPI00196596A4|nr:GPO family capsid scaffolding protein [Glaciimonas sp. PAMC28666]QRX82318.1 GPO family capsid scaffolding protein [Glaciimonas sp. PAMC28666]
MTDKQKSKFFRVALEGATTDGRVIDRAFIEQMAARFNPATYGARVWLEHRRGLLPDGPYKAYGDVLAVKAEEVVLDGIKKLALYAQVSPTPDLIAMNKARQKIYTSIEINPSFADTDQAYLVGLAVTDSPASLGTEILTFAAQNPAFSPFSSRKQDPNNLFSVAVETELEFEDDLPTQPEGIKLTDAVKNILKRFTTKTTSDSLQFADITEAVALLATNVNDNAEQFANSQERINVLEAALAASNEAFATFKQAIDATDGNPTQRPAATGGIGAQQTDY